MFISIRKLLYGYLIYAMLLTTLRNVNNEFSYNWNYTVLGFVIIVDSNEVTYILSNIE